MTPSDTPKTDAATQEEYEDLAYLSRQLERENNNLRAEVEGLKEIYQAAYLDWRVQMTERENRVDALKLDIVQLRSRVAELEQAWQTGTPDVEDGKRSMFWCATRNSNGKINHRFLVYLKGYVMPLCDFLDDPGDDAVPVGDDGDFAWTGWFEESCDQCETQWRFTHEVVQWMRLPAAAIDAAKDSTK